MNPTDSQSADVDRGFPIVGIGASAGGLETLRLLFGEMPDDTGAGFVLVQHLDPTHDSLLAELLARYAHLPVVQVEDGMRVEPNRLHVIPPNAEMTITDGVLRLNAPTERRGLRMPVDRFFSSLAEDQQDRAVAIVLSGAGSDGTYGVRLIKARGGMVLAQDPTTAGYDGMPRSAVATGDVDYVLPVKEIPEVLVQYLRYRREQRAAPGGAHDPNYLDNILALLLARQGQDFRGYKRGTIKRRIQRRMGLHHLTSVKDYHTRLRDDEAEVQALVRDLLIGVTSFFREPEAWNLLRDKVLVDLHRHLGKDDVLRAWVPGCATGEEAYTLAMLLIEAGEAAGRARNIMVFATDVDRDALEVARSGVYAESLVADIDADRLARFFVREGDHYVVRKLLRERVIFAPQNLISDPPFSKLSLISCRNLLIYIEPDLQGRLLELFHFALRSGGYLFLGSSETVGREPRLFKAVSKKWRIYQRLDTGPAHGIHLPLSPPLPADMPHHSAAPPQRHRGVGAVVEKTLIEQFAPPSVLVDREYRALYFHGRLRDYLGPAPGDPSNDLLAMAGEGMRNALRGALYEAAAKDAPKVVVRSAHVRRGGQWFGVRIVVTRVGAAAESESLLLVSFQGQPDTEADSRPPGAVADSDGSLLSQLEAELKATRAELNDTVAQMETSNEELKASNEEVMSMNEELQSTNEELETSKEELQSLNEELTTLNSQLEDKVHELEDTNNDLNNFLVSTEIATVFLDRQFRIRRYTPAFAHLMRLIPADIGREVTDITWRFEDPDLLDDAQAVLGGRQSEPREVHTEDQTCHIRGILPYRTDAANIEGVVVTFTDITPRKRMENALRQSESYLRRITDSIPVLIAYVDAEFHYRFANAAYARWVGIEQEAALDRSVAELLGDEAFAQVRPRMQAALAGESVSFEAWINFLHRGLRYVAAQYVPDQDDHGQVQGIFILISDLTDKRRIEERVEELNAESRRRLDELEAVLEAAPVGIFLGRDQDCGDVSINRAGARMLRIPPDMNPSRTGPDAHQLNYRVYHGGRELETHELPMQRAAREGHSIQGFEEIVEFPDGERINLLTYATPLYDEHNEIRGCVGAFADVTQVRSIEREYYATAERLRVHIDNSPLAVMEWDRDMVITSWSDSAEKVFGWPAAEAVGTELGSLGIVHAEDLGAVSTEVAALLDGNAQTSRRLNRNRRKDGSLIWCEWVNSILRDADGGMVSGLSMALDVTERKALEDALRENTRRLEEVDRRKDEFLAMLGHELRNPLTPIRNAIQLLGIRADSGADAGWVAQVIDRQTAQMQRMVDDLLDVARIRKGILSLELGPQHLQRLLQDTLAALQPAIEEKHHELVAVLPDAPIHVSGDAERLIQVFSNLLNNAVRYTPAGGRIEVTLRRTADGLAEVIVADDGKGISPELLPLVFDIYNQGQAVAERSNAGLGLGLTLVKQIVRLHNGEVTAASEGLGRGSRFTLRLPLLEGTPPVDSTAEGAPPAPGKYAEPLDILVVDDNVDVLDSLGRLLEALGHRVTTLDSGRAAVEQVRAHPPDLVLLDVGLPDMDGYRVARELAKLPERSRFRVVAVTGYAPGTRDEDGGSANLDAHLLKPLTLEVLAPYLQKP